MFKEKIKCNGDCFNCLLPVEKCKGQPKNKKAAYKPESKRKRKKTYTLPGGPNRTHPARYRAGSFRSFKED